MNTFQEQLVEYFGGSTGGALGPGITTSNLAGTESNTFFVNYSPDTFNECDVGFEFRGDAGAQVSYIDVHTTPGYFNNNFDYRMIFGGGATGVDGQGGVNFQGQVATFFHPIRTNPPAAALPPSWYIDYGEVVATAGVNQDSTITFNTTFPVAPKVFLQLFDIDGPGVTPVPSGFVYHTYNITTTGCTVRGLGDLPANFKYQWTAIGGV